MNGKEWLGLLFFGLSCGLMGWVLSDAQTSESPDTVISYNDDQKRIYWTSKHKLPLKSGIAYVAYKTKPKTLQMILKEQQFKNVLSCRKIK